MAGKNIKGITIEFNGDTKKLDKALREVNKESKDIDKELKEVNKALKFNPGNVTLTQQKMELLKQKVDMTKNQLKEYQQIQKNLSAEGVEKNSAEWREVERKIIEAESKVKHFEGQLKSMQTTKLDEIKRKAKEVGESFKSAGKKMQSVGGGATLAGAGMVALGAQFVEAAEVQLGAEDKLTQAYKNHVKGGEEAAKSVMEYASALQNQGVVGDEVTLAGAGILAGYTSSEKSIEKLLPAMDDILVKQKGLNGTQEDAEGIAKSLGKALNGNVGAFTKLGISLTDDQKKQFKLMDESERLEFILSQVNDRVGGMNEEFAKTDSGKLQQAKNTIGDLSEEFGKVLLPAIADVATWLSENLLPKIQSFMDAAKEHPIIGKIAVALTAIMVVGGPFLAMIGTIVSIIGTLIPLFAGLEVSIMATVAPVLAVVAGIAALIAIIVLCVKHWDKIKEVATSVVEGIKTSINNFVIMFRKKISDMILSVKAKINQAKSLLKSFGDTTKKVFKAVVNGITAPYRKAWNLIKNIISKIKGLFPIQIKMPHLSISPAGWSPSDILSGVLPSFGIDWYKNGGVFSSPSVIGVGEAGSEAVVPLDKFWTKMDDMTASIVSGVQMGMASAAGASQINITVELGGTKVGEQIVKLYDRTKKAVG